MNGHTLFNLLFLAASLALTGVLVVLLKRCLPIEHVVHKWVDRHLNRMGFVELARSLGLLVLVTVAITITVLYS